MNTAASAASREPTPQPTTLGSRIAAARRASGLTQEQLGIGLGPDGSDLGKGAVSAWEVDRSQPSAQQIALLASRLGVSADSLLGLN
jgi:HTH-type transcriptional regulator, cell division transcriptional repressor